MLEARLADERLDKQRDDLAMAPERQPASSLASELETILRRQDNLRQPVRPFAHPAQSARTSFVDHQPALNRPQPDMAHSRPAARVAMTAPPLAADHHAPAPIVPDDFAKFAEAVRLIGLAAQRFLPEGLAREALPKGQTSELVAMYAVMQEAISAFRSIADDIAVSASEIRRYARPETAKPVPAALRRDEAELVQLTADLDNMRERVAMMMQERRRAGG